MCEITEVLGAYEYDNHVGANPPNCVVNSPEIYSCLISAFFGRNTLVSLGVFPEFEASAFEHDSGIFREDFRDFAGKIYLSQELLSVPDQSYTSEKPSKDL